MRISDWSSDVCSSDLADIGRVVPQEFGKPRLHHFGRTAAGRVQPAFEQFRRPQTHHVADGGFGDRLAAHAAKHMVQRGGELRAGVDKRAVKIENAEVDWNYAHDAGRTEEHLVGKEGGRKCRTRWCPYQ